MNDNYEFVIYNKNMEIMKSFEFKGGLMSSEALNYIKACAFNGDLKELKMFKNNELEKVFTTCEVIELINM